ncbi:hypothetical protein [Amycolatopsis nigrescens]|uniref:hypothetical protein n=1 Tax=Amycolatopsis nigrescens TaxID=381445 RepID=UPI000363468B|nr:hypothetical protein [Amycolatopsis nigrescens]
MSRRYDPDQIAVLAKKVGDLKDAYRKTGTDLGNGDPGGAYGDLSNAASAGKAMQGFYGGVNSQLDAAAKLVEAASKALANAAERMQNDEDAVIHTLEGGNPR